MADPRFKKGDMVKFRPSPFLERSIGYLSKVQVAIRNNEIFEVIGTSYLLDDQFITVKNSKGEPAFTDFNAHLFVKI